MIDTTLDPEFSPPEFSKYEALRLARHAASQTASDKRRRAKRAPKRDDVARVALYFLLLQLRTTRHERVREQIQATLLRILMEGGFDRSQCVRVLDFLTSKVGLDLDKWLMRRGADDATRASWQASIEESLSAADKE